MDPRLASSALLSLLGASLTAQNGLNESRGVLAGAATAIFVDGGVSGGHDAQTRVHRNGMLGGPTQPLPPVANPPDLHEILTQHGAPAGLDIDDFCLGRDDVMVNNGYLAVPPSSWSVWSFSLTNAAQGQAGSRIAEEAALGHVGAALFSWVLEGSALPPATVARTERSHSWLDLGLGGMVNPEVDAVDFPLMLGLDQGSLATLEPGFVPLIPTPMTIYFTVSHATRGLVPLAWWAGTPPSGATILKVSRLATAPVWGTPTVFVPFFALQLAQNEDIDALAYDAVRQRLLFSTTGNLRDQFLVADLCAGPVMPEPVKMADGTPVSQHVGKLQTDDVDAVCTLDPQLTSSGPPPLGDDFGSSCGAYQPGLLGVPEVQASAYRRFEGGQIRFDTWMVGWPPITDISPGFAALFVTLGPGLVLIPADLQVRNTAASVPGDPRSYSLPVPATMALSGADLTFRWVAIDAMVTEIAEAWPVRVFL